MSGNYFVQIVASVALISCVAALALWHPIRVWPAVRWVDHSDQRVRLLYRASLLMACVLLPLSLTWLGAGVAVRYVANAFDPQRFQLLLQVAVLAVPIPFTYALYRGLLAHVRNRQ